MDGGGETLEALLMSRCSAHPLHHTSEGLHASIADSPADNVVQTERLKVL